MLIDFKEIPQSNNTGDKQDVFEKFCRDFLVMLGYKIEQEPARGADGGIDIKVSDIRKGVSGETIVYWLVSCKHYAHSGKSITKELEPDIIDRVIRFGCTGFIGLYSTIANTSLLNHLEAIKTKIEYQLFDNEKIENHIVGIHSIEDLMIRYFPESFKKWKELKYMNEPIQLFDFYLNNYRVKKGVSLFSISKDFFLRIFHSSGNMFKQLKKHSDLQSAIIEENVNYFIVEEFSEKIKSSESVKLAINERLERFIERKKITDFNIELPIPFGFDGEIILYSYNANFLFVSEKMHQELLNDFNHLKSILN